jgi:Hemerythrin HHE cation binding domain
MTQTAQRDVISLLIQDHREVDELLVRLEELADESQGGAGAPGAGGRGEARTVAGQVIVELTGHWAAERRYLYPLVRKRVPGGVAIAERDTAEQAEVEDDLRALDLLDPAQREFWGRVAVLTDRVRAHVRDEEIELFPLVRDAVPRKVLVELACRVGTGQLRTTLGVVDA